MSQIRNQAGTGFLPISRECQNKAHKPDSVITNHANPMALEFTDERANAPINAISVTSNLSNFMNAAVSVKTIPEPD